MIKLPKATYRSKPPNSNGPYYGILSLNLPQIVDKHTSYRNKSELAHTGASAPMAVGGIGWQSNTFGVGTAAYWQKLTHKLQKPTMKWGSSPPGLGPLHA